MLSLVTVELQLCTERDRDQGVWPRDPDEFLVLLHAKAFGTARVLAQDPISATFCLDATSVAKCEEQASRRIHAVV